MHRRGDLEMLQTAPSLGHQELELLRKHFNLGTPVRQSLFGCIQVTTNCCLHMHDLTNVLQVVVEPQSSPSIRWHISTGSPSTCTKTLDGIDVLALL